MFDGQFYPYQSIQFLEGLLAPPPGFTAAALVLIDRTAGTNIGDMTTNGGLAAAFDGGTSETLANSARGATQANPAVGWVGKTLTAPKIFGQALIYGSTDQGFITNQNVSTTINIRGKNGAAPSSRTDGTIVGTITFTDTSDESAGQQIDSTDLGTAWDHIFAEVVAADVSTRVCCAELVLYEWA